MHLKNPFINSYDFEALILSYPDLANYTFVNQFGTKTIKFSDQNAVKALNSALLKHQYGIDWSIPQNNLCPPIPGRLDYLLHINDLLKSTSNKASINLLDIGTGANMIYPILGTCHFNWKCFGTDFNTNSINNAQRIKDHNPQLNTIELYKQTDKNQIFKTIIQNHQYFDVVVCNPPFFKSSKDAEKNNHRKVKNLKLSSAEKLNFGGLNNELWCKGGEEAFVKKMAIESADYKSQVKWFTALISNKDHLKNIKRTINKLHPSQLKVINMEQGNKISRFIAWSFEVK